MTIRYKLFMETFYSTTGIKSQSGEILMQSLDRVGKTRFLRRVRGWQYEFSQAQTQLACQLLLDHFQKAVDLYAVQYEKKNWLPTFQANVLKAIFREKYKTL
jgi:hypothetical protein